MSDLAPLKDLLIREGLWANKALGQHFLLDPEITRRIAAHAGDLSGQAVIEVGPGPGGLTRALLLAGADPVFAIEKDTRFLPILADLAAWSNGRLRVIEADALEVDESALAPHARIISNLPYNVGTPLLVKWLKAGAWRGPMTLMFQLEVAERIVAKPGAAAYGRLAVLTQAMCEARIVMKLPPRAFTPAPKVASAVVHLTDRADRFDDLAALETITAAAFGQRRKMLRSSLKQVGDAQALLAACALDGARRAEELTNTEFRALAKTWRALGP
jgi:16S rRNA (adenine1518-N6/adenine1519-N6)-dimethyltransferase